MSSIKNHIADLYLKFRNPIMIVLYVLLISAIVHVSQIPNCYKMYGNNIILRAIFFGLIIATNNYISYMHALLLALFVLLFLSFSPGFIEKFEDVKKIAKTQRRWHDEQVLGENPIILETDGVNTEAIQSS